jgi:tetratricopeptide (TPR) repeat protein
MNKDFMKKTAVFVIFIFGFFLWFNAFPKNTDYQKSGKKLLKEGEDYYKNGEYEKVLEAFTAAEPLIKEKNERVRLYLDMSLTHYALGNNNQTGEFLEKLFQLGPGFSIPEESYPARFLSIFTKVKAEIKTKTKADEQAKKKKQEKVIEKPTEKKKKKKFPALLVVAGIAVN